MAIFFIAKQPYRNRANVDVLAMKIKFSLPIT